MRIAAAAFACLLAGTAPAAAQPGSHPVDVHGYVKVLPLLHAAPDLAFPGLPAGRGVLTYSRLRLEGRRSLGGSVTLRAAGELETLAGDGADGRLLGRGGRGGPAWAAEWFLARESDLRSRLFLDRLYVEGYRGSWTLTLGKQRIAWGSGQFWNPTDLLDPFGPLSLDREDRPGSDAVRVDRQLGPVSMLTGVFVVGEEAPGSASFRNRSLQALRLRTNRGGWDIALMAAQNRGDVVGGLDLSGYVGGAGVYLESAVVRRPEREIREEAGRIVRRTVDHDVRIEAVAGGSYGFPSGWILRGEVFLNGGGSSPGDASPDGIPAYDWEALLRGELLAPARVYSVWLASYPLTPLLTPEAAVLFNHTDGGVAFLPGLTWSVATNLRLFAGAQLYASDPDDEFALYPDSAYLLLKQSF